MQSWIPEIWQAAVIGLVVGVILGYLLLRLTKGSVKKQVQTEAELKEVKFLPRKSSLLIWRIMLNSTKHGMNG